MCFREASGSSVHMPACLGCSSLILCVLAVVGYGCLQGCRGGVPYTPWWWYTLNTGVVHLKHRGGGTP